ncbi:unnamed protein product [Diplocarpon coronariae]
MSILVTFLRKGICHKAAMPFQLATLVSISTSPEFPLLSSTGGGFSALGFSRVSCIACDFSPRSKRQPSAMPPWAQGCRLALGTRRLVRLAGRSRLIGGSVHWWPQVLLIIILCDCFPFRVKSFGPCHRRRRQSRPRPAMDFPTQDVPTAADGVRSGGHEKTSISASLPSRTIPFCRLSEAENVALIQHSVGDVRHQGVLVGSLPGLTPREPV